MDVDALFPVFTPPDVTRDLSGSRRDAIRAAVKQCATVLVDNTTEQHAGRAEALDYLVEAYHSANDAAIAADSQE